MKKYELLAPNNKKIIGFKTEEGSIIKCTHINWETDALGSNTYVYEMPQNSISTLSQKTIFVDENNNLWPEADVLHASII